MPSLLSVSESDPRETAIDKKWDNDITVGMDEDTENIEKTDCHSQTPKLDNGSDAVLCSSTAEPDASISTPNNKKRRVSPDENSGSKQKQQKKVNQMSLSSFFFNGGNNTTSASTPSAIVKDTESDVPPIKSSSATNNLFPVKEEKGATKTIATVDLTHTNSDTEDHQSQDANLKSECNSVVNVTAGGMDSAAEVEIVCVKADEKEQSLPVESDKTDDTSRETEAKKDESSTVKIQVTSLREGFYCEDKYLILDTNKSGKEATPWARDMPRCEHKLCIEATGMNWSNSSYYLPGESHSNFTVRFQSVEDVVRHHALNMDTLVLASGGREPSNEAERSFHRLIQYALVPGLQSRWSEIRKITRSEIAYLLKKLGYKCAVGPGGNDDSSWEPPEALVVTGHLKPRYESLESLCEALRFVEGDLQSPPSAASRRKQEMNISPTQLMALRLCVAAGFSGEDDQEEKAAMIVLEPIVQKLIPSPVKSKKGKKGKSPSKMKNTNVTKKKKSSETSNKTTVVKKLSEEELSEEATALLKKYRNMKDLYLKRADDVTNRYKNGLDEEDFGTIKYELLSDDTDLKLNDTKHCEEFPPQVIANMALLIEGSELPLSRLVSKMCAELENIHKVVWSADSISTKIKIMSQRKANFEPIKKCTENVDLYEDSTEERLWRWEVTTLDLLNSDVSPKARKARSARKKISSYQSALLKLVKSLEKIEDQLFDAAIPNLDKSKAKINQDEERVLKFERDAERQRLAEESKARKLQEKLQEQAAKKKAREEALEASRRKKEEAAEKKKEAAQAREDEKRKKEKEKLQREEEVKMQKRKKLETVSKQKATFRSFFAAPKKTDSKKPTIADSTSETFDVESFRSMINSSTDTLELPGEGQKRSASAKASRKRRTKMVDVSVFKTVIADNTEWGTPDYLEQTTIKVPNKYRFLSFHEDCRPAYHGTWSKNSSIITGKNPFRKDTTVFDYDYDSEAEWEEGDDELGEDVEDDTKNQEDELDGEGNAKMYDFDDGFCVADDRLLDNEEDADEEAKALYKKKMMDREHEEHMHSNRIKIIAPGVGGLPLHLTESAPLSAACVEGVESDHVADILSSYKAIQLSDPKFCLDAFPQLHVSEENRTESNTNGNSNKDDYSTEAMIALAQFCHHSTHNSKDKLVEELKTLHPEFFSIRAKATRKLDAIAIKKKHPKYSGVYWEVKSDVLTELGLTDIMEKKVEDIIYDSTISEKTSLPKDDHISIKTLLSKDDRVSKNSPIRKETAIQSTAEEKAKPKNQTTLGQAFKKRKGTKGEASTNASGENEKKGSPKPKDASASMKNLMAQFVKKSPTKSTTCSLQNINKLPKQKKVPGVQKRKIENVDPDPPPKKPLTAYLMYTNKLRSKVREENPNMSPNDVSKKLGEIWRAVPAVKKEVLKADYLKELEVYKQKMKEWEHRNPGREKPMPKKRKKQPQSATKEQHASSKSPSSQKS